MTIEPPQMTPEQEERLHAAAKGLAEHFGRLIFSLIQLSAMRPEKSRHIADLVRAALEPLSSSPPPPAPARTEN